MQECFLNGHPRRKQTIEVIKKTMQRTSAAMTFFCLLTINLMLASCGGGGGSEGVSSGGASSRGTSTDVVSGVASVGAPLGGQVKIKDASTPAREKAAVIGSDGSFAFDVSDMRGPFILRATGSAQGANYTMYSFAEKSGTANINPLSSALVANAAGVDDPAAIYENPDPAILEKIKSALPEAATTLQLKIKPLLHLYGAKDTDPIKARYRANHEGLDGIFDNVKVVLSHGTLTIINAATDAVIFTAKITEIKDGHFTDNDDDLPKPGSLPEDPDDVMATGGSNQVTISWPMVSGASSYNIYWSTTSGVTTANGTKIAGATSPTVQTGLTAGTAYYYVMTAVNSAGESSPSIQAAATTLSATPSPTLPAAPAGVTATGGANQLTISWSAVSGANSYNVYWSTTSGVTTSSGTRIAGVTSPYVHTGLSASTAYYYIVTAVNGVGESPASSQVTATTAAPALDGAALYAQTCSGCHGPLATPTRRIVNKTITGIRNAGMAWGLSDAQLTAIIAVLP